MKKKDTANINAALYDGEFQWGCDCIGEVTCRFALCSTMPPDGNEECFFREHGSCKCPSAQQVALERLRNRLTRELKKHSEGEA